MKLRIVIQVLLLLNFIACSTAFKLPRFDLSNFKIRTDTEIKTRGGQENDGARLRDGSPDGQPPEKILHLDIEELKKDRHGIDKKEFENAFTHSRELKKHLHLRVPLEPHFDASKKASQNSSNVESQDNSNYFSNMDLSNDRAPPVADRVRVWFDKRFNQEFHSNEVITLEMSASPKSGPNKGATHYTLYPQEYDDDTETVLFTCSQVLGPHLSLEKWLKFLKEQKASITDGEYKSWMNKTQSTQEDEEIL